MTFSECDDDAPGLKLLGMPCTGDKENQPCLNLLQLDENQEAGLNFNGVLNVMMKESDLKFGNWKKTIAYLSVR